MSENSASTSASSLSVDERLDDEQLNLRELEGTIYDQSMVDNDKYIWSYHNKVLIEAVQNIFTGVLNEETTRSEHPDGFRDIRLKEHQLTTMYAMRKLESSPSRYFHNLNVGVLADPVGSGKSYSLLGHLMANPLLRSEWKNWTCKEHHPLFTGFEYEAEHHIPVNLLVVSHSIYNQWLDYLSHTNLKVYKIHRRSEFGETFLSLINKISEELYNVVLLKANLWNDFVSFMNMDGVNSPSVKYVRNQMLVDALSNIPTHPDLYRQHLKTLLNDMKGLVKEIRPDNLISNRLGTLMFERDQINSLLTSIEEEIKIIRSLPDKYNLGVAFDALNSFGGKNVTERVKFIKTNIIWERIIFDEVDTLKISAAKSMYAKFYWMITNNIENLIFPNKVSHIQHRVLNYIQTRNPSVKQFIPLTASGFTTKGFLRDIWESADFSKYYIQMRNIFLRNNREYVESSFLHELTAPIYYRYWLRAPYEMELVNNVLGNRSIIENLQAGDWSGALQAFSNKSHITATQEDFLNKIHEQLKEKINSLMEQVSKHEKNITNDDKKLVYWNSQKTRLENELEGLDQNRNPDLYEDLQVQLCQVENRVSVYQQKIRLSNQHIEENKENITKIEGQSDRLVHKISEDLKSSHCSICLEKYQAPIACVPCCNNMFCMECIMTWIERNHKCALCRTNLDIKSCSILEERLKESVENEVNVDDSDSIELHSIDDIEVNMDKLVYEKTFDLDKARIVKQLISNILEKSNTRILLYTEYDTTFNQYVLPWMNENQIEYELLSGNSGSIDSRIRRFKEGNTRVLLLNARYFGSGLNLEMASDLILYHRMTEPLERQILGRAQRFGRKNALRVHSLLYRGIEVVSPIYTN